MTGQNLLSESYQSMSRVRCCCTCMMRYQSMPANSVTLLDVVNLDRLVDEGGHGDWTVQTDYRTAAVVVVED